MNWQTYLPTPAQIEADNWNVEEALAKLWAKSGHKKPKQIKRGLRWGLRNQAHTIFGPQCFYCQAASGNTLDHLIPKSLGGKDELSNVVPCCEPCNTKKGNRLPTTNEMARHRVKWKESKTA